MRQLEAHQTEECFQVNQLAERVAPLVCLARAWNQRDFENSSAVADGKQASLRKWSEFEKALRKEFGSIRTDKLKIVLGLKSA